MLKIFIESAIEDAGGRNVILLCLPNNPTDLTSDEPRDVAFCAEEYLMCLLVCRTVIATRTS